MKEQRDIVDSLPCLIEILLVAAIFITLIFIH